MSVLGLEVQYYLGGQRDDAALQKTRVAFERAGAEVTKFDAHVFPRLIPVFQEHLKRQFGGEGVGPSGAWVALSPAYAAAKAVKYPGRPILVRTGAMRMGLTDSRSRYAARDVTQESMVFGTEGVPYASFHQLGTENGLPARPMFDFGDDFEGDLFGAARLGVLAAIREAKVQEVAEVGGGDAGG